MKIDTFFPNVCNFEIDYRSQYKTKLLHYRFRNGLYYSYRPIIYKNNDAIMLHTIEASNPRNGEWKEFWKTLIENKEAIISEGFRYILIDCILEPYFDQYIAKNWKLVRQGELPDPSTWNNTYYYDLWEKKND